MPTPPSTSPPHSGRPRARETVLVVDDEPIARSVIGYCLSKAGYRILEASSGAEALRVADEHDEIVLLVTDVMMPHMTGFELAGRLSATRSLGVIFVSGYNTDFVRGGVVEQDAVFIEKPFAPAALIAAADRVLDDIQQRAAFC